jgi:hypothetical protein
LKLGVIVVAIERLVRHCIGLREVKLSGVHCGICGKWIHQPVTLWRREGKVSLQDGVGLCDKCAASSYTDDLPPIDAMRSVLEFMR